MTLRSDSDPLWWVVNRRERRRRGFSMVRTHIRELQPGDVVISRNRALVIDHIGDTFVWAPDHPLQIRVETLNCGGWVFSADAQPRRLTPRLAESELASLRVELDALRRQSAT